MPAIRKDSVIQKATPVSKRVKCSAWWCSKTFNRAADMRRHCDHKHLGFFYQCTFCGYKCAQKDAVETHVNNVHTRGLASICSCGQGFTDPSALCRHRKATGHARNINPKRGSSGAVIRGREPGTEDLTQARIMDTSYLPVLFTEDGFTFSPSGDSCPSGSSTTSSGKLTESSTSSPILPTSMSGPFNFDIMEHLSPSPRSFSSSMDSPGSQYPNDSTLLALNTAMDQIHSTCEWDPQAFVLGTESLASSDPALSWPQRDWDYGASFGTNSTSHELQPVSSDASLVTNVQDAFLNRMMDWAQGTNIFHGDLAQPPPIQQMPTVHFMHDIRF